MYSMTEAKFMRVIIKRQREYMINTMQKVVDFYRTTSHYKASMKHHRRVKNRNKLYQKRKSRGLI